MKKLFITLLICVFMLAACTESGNTSSDGGASDISDVFYNSSASSENAESSADDTSSDDVSSETMSEGKDIDRTKPKKLISLACTYTANGTPHSQYADDGRSMTDGIFDSDVGVGWSTSCGELVLDLGETVDDIADLDIALRGDAWGITAPTTAVYSVSVDGKAWFELGTVEATRTQGYGEWGEYTYLLELSKTATGRYVRVVLTGSGMNYVWGREMCVYAYRESKGELKMHEFGGTESFDNLTLDMPEGTRMGDNDGPAYCVYGKTGYNSASFSFDLSETDFVGTGKNGTRVNGYMFLGADVYDQDGRWINCCDAGFVYEYSTKGWRLFYATAATEQFEGQWFSGTRVLDQTHNYRLTLDTSIEDGMATLTAYDLVDECIADRLTFSFGGSKKDGSNTAFLMNAAIDWVDRPENDFIGETNKNLGSGIHLKDVRIYDCKVYKDGAASDFVTHHRAVWPDSSMPVSASVVKIHHATGDNEFIIDIDLG